MSLGLSASSGEMKPIVKYDARAGRFFRIDRADGVSTPVEITNGFKAVFDLATVEVGYVHFSEGGAPEWAMVRLGQQLPPRPSKEFRQGFRMSIKLPAALGGDVREFASAAACVIAAVDSLHTAYLAAPESKVGKLPIVAMTGASMVKSGQSTNYAPTLIIVGWADRVVMGTPAPVAGMVASPVAPPVNGRPNPVQTPPAVPQASASEFGHSQGSSDLDDSIPF